MITGAAARLRVRRTGSLIVTPSIALLVGCASRTLTGDSEDLPAGALRVMQVTGVAYAAVLNDASAVLRGELAAARGTEWPLSDGQLVAGRVYCCGGPDEFVTGKYLFAPRTIQIKKSDFVEVRFGRSASGDMNLVTRAVSGCGWVPRDPKLWVRVPSCDWMPGEGWIEKRSILTSQNHARIKLPAK
ncbi:MAG: hypothetical protein WAU52_12990 [Burkholderiales bacterium]